ncbi:MAG: hypothetical protein NC082_04875 [Clostridiales bacterium]|nr:hypothetical protein [Clostridiales bacterium]
MEILNLLIQVGAHIPEHHCHHHAMLQSGSDFASVLTVCITVFLCVLVLAICIHSIITRRRNQNVDISASGDTVARTCSQDYNDWKTKEQYDAAWRIVNMSWKVEHAEGKKAKDEEPSTAGNDRLTEADARLYEAASKYLMDFMGHDFEHTTGDK